MIDKLRMVMLLITYNACPLALFVVHSGKKLERAQTLWCMLGQSLGRISLGNYHMKLHRHFCFPNNLQGNILINYSIIKLLTVTSSVSGRVVLFYPRNFWRRLKGISFPSVLLGELMLPWSTLYVILRFLCPIIQFFLMVTTVS